MTAEATASDWLECVIILSSVMSGKEKPMVSINRQVLYGGVYHDVRCLSTDEKPTENIRNGSTLVEIDTGDKYLFDEEFMTWNPVDGAFDLGPLGPSI